MTAESTTPEIPANSGDAKPAKAAPAAKKAAAGEAAPKAAGEAAPKAPKKEKAPALEDKPFAEFIQQDFVPALKAGLEKQGITDLTLTLAQEKIQVSGFTQEPACWQVIGKWNDDNRQFNLYFFKEDIQGPRAFSYSDRGGKPSTLEPFLIDERKVSLDLMVFGVTQRLNGQKWLGRN